MYVLCSTHNYYIQMAPYPILPQYSGYEGIKLFHEAPTSNIVCMLDGYIGAIHGNILIRQTEWQKCAWWCFLCILLWPQRPPLPMSHTCPTCRSTHTANSYQLCLEVWSKCSWKLTMASTVERKATFGCRRRVECTFCTAAMLPATTLSNFSLSLKDEGQVVSLNGSPRARKNHCLKRTVTLQDTAGNNRTMHDPLWCVFSLKSEIGVIFVF